MERLAKQYGASHDDANSLAAIAEADAFEIKAKRHARHEYHKLEESTDAWLSLSGMTNAEYDNLESNYTDNAKAAFSRRMKKNYGL